LVELCTQPIHTVRRCRCRVFRQQCADISFLRLIGRIVAFAIDDNFNLKQAEAANAELQRQNERLQRSERELCEVIETIPYIVIVVSSSA
jgi:hypothetical protein